MQADYIFISNEQLGHSNQCSDTINTESWAACAAVYEENLDRRLFRLGLITLIVLALGAWSLFSILSFLLG